MTREIKIVVEKHPDGYIAYPLGLQGVVAGEGDSYEAALADVKSALRFHLGTFARKVPGGDSAVLDDNGGPGHPPQQRRPHGGRLHSAENRCPGTQAPRPLQAKAATKGKAA